MPKNKNGEVQILFSAVSISCIKPTTITPLEAKNVVIKPTNNLNALKQRLENDQKIYRYAWGKKNNYKSKILLKDQVNL